MNRYHTFFLIVASQFISSLAQAAVSLTLNISTGSFSITPGTAVINQQVAVYDITADQNFTVNLYDSNNGTMNFGAASLPFTVTYNAGSEITLSTTPFAVETGASLSASRAISVFIASSASIGIPAGAYTDSITIEILAI